MKKFFALSALFVITMQFDAFSQVHSIQTKSGEDRPETTTKLSSVPTRSGQSSRGSGDCSGPIHPKEFYQLVYENEINQLIVKIQGGESHTFKGNISKRSNLDENYRLMIKGETGMAYLDLCGIFMLEINGNTAEIWIDRN